MIQPIMLSLAQYLIFIILYGLIYIPLSAQSGSITNRIIKNVELIEKSCIPLDFQAAAPVWYNGEIYCVNFNNQSIDVIDPDTHKIKRQIGRHGPGPGEFQTISAYTVDKYGVSVIDGGRLTITEFDHQGKMIKLYKHSRQMISALRLANPPYYLVKPIVPLEENREKFEVVNIDTKEIQPVFAFSKLSSRDADVLTASLQTIYFEGPMVKNGSGYVFRVPWLCSEFVAFDEKSGRVLYGRQTIDQSTIKDAPLSSSKSDGETKKVSVSLASMRRVNLAAAANSQYLLVLSNAASPTVKDFKTNWTDERIVDAYKVKNGDYAFSFAIPKHNGRRAKEISMTEDMLCVLYDDEVVRYSFRLPK